MQIVILAGGLGTRVQGIAGDGPKHLIPFRGFPFAHYQLRWIAGCGIPDVVYCVGHRGERIRSYVGDGEAWKLRVRYVDEGDTLRGTAGALRLALDEGVLEPWFLVVYGDSFLPVDFRQLGEAFRAQDRPAMMAVLRNRDRWDRSNVRYAAGRVELYQKVAAADANGLDHIDYGISALRAEVIETRVAAGAVADLSDLYHQLSIDGGLAGYEVQERFYEIGSPEGLRDFDAWLDERERKP